MLLKTLEYYRLFLQNLTIFYRGLVYDINKCIHLPKAYVTPSILVKAAEVGSPCSIPADLLERYRQETGCRAISGLKEMTRQHDYCLFRSWWHWVFRVIAPHRYADNSPA